MKYARTCYFLTALVTTGAITYLLAMIRRERIVVPVLLYSHPEGGEREGEFELFIGS